MIRPTPDDVGRRVVFADDRLHIRETGVLVGFDLHWAYVQYDREQKTKMTRREALVWEEEKLPN